MSVVLHVMDVDFTLRGEIVHYTSLCMVRERAGAGSFSVNMHAKEAEAAGVQIGRVLFPVEHPERAGMIEGVTRAEGTDTVTVSGVMLAGLLGRRLALPDAAGSDGSGYDSICADAESVMQHYVSGNLTAPLDANRKMACLALEENRQRGMAEVRWRARYEPLGELLSAIGAYADAGYDVTPDFAQEKLVFRFQPGRDLTGSTGGKRVTFSLGMGSAQGVTRVADESGAKTTAYIGGAGEGAERAIGEAGHTAAGLARREVFVDAGALAEADELIDAGERALSGYAAVDSLTCEVLDGGTLQYGRDWDIGDLVNVQGAGMMRQLRVTQVTQRLEAGRGERLSVIFGEPERGITVLLKRLQGAAIR